MVLPLEVCLEMDFPVSIKTLLWFGNSIKIASLLPRLNTVISRLLEEVGIFNNKTTTKETEQIMLYILFLKAFFMQKAAKMIKIYIKITDKMLICCIKIVECGALAKNPAP